MAAASSKTTHASWTVKLFEEMLLADGKSTRLARSPNRERDTALRILSASFPDVEVAREALADLGRVRRRRWTPEEIRTLKRKYPETETATIAADLDRPLRSVYAKAYDLNLRKSNQEKRRLGVEGGRRLRVVGEATRFSRGHGPHNRGHKGWDAGGRSHETRFHSGQRGNKWVPVGSERLNDGYLERKISETGYSPRDWEPVHRILWVERHGDVPANHVVVFRNGDKTDLRIENLELITRRELMHRNTIHNLPEPVTDAIRALTSLKRSIRKLEKKEDQ